MASAVPRLCTAKDLIALGDAPAEIVAGTIVYKAEPSAEHGDAQAALAAFLREPFHRRAGSAGPGGFWILTEVDVELAVHEVYRPDLSGWRRERRAGASRGAADWRSTGLGLRDPFHEQCRDG